MEACCSLCFEGVRVRDLNKLRIVLLFDPRTPAAAIIVWCTVGTTSVALGVSALRGAPLVDLWAAASGVYEVYFQSTLLPGRSAACLAHEGPSVPICASCRAGV